MEKLKNRNHELLEENRVVGEAYEVLKSREGELLKIIEDLREENG